MDALDAKALELLKKMIATPSLSREEDRVAAVIQTFLNNEGVTVNRKLNNLWAVNTHFDDAKPTVLLNSHHDTVKPNSEYTRDPFSPSVEEGKLFGLGSNDAGGPLVCLMATFLHYYHQPNLKYNIALAVTAEEEISGSNGVECIWKDLPSIDFAIVGEPTLCHMAVAEKGLMVLDCVAKGKPGHAAREEGVNAIYEAIEDIEWIRRYKFPKISPTLGDMKMTVTIMQAGSQHNVVPGECHFTIDVRVTDKYSLEETLSIIQSHLKSEVKPRSIRMQSSGIALTHPIVLAGEKLGLKQYGSPTTSDQALMPVPSIKLGPGDSARSHSADEFIYIEEITQGIKTYIGLLDEVII